MSMTDFLFICSIKSPQCTDKYSKKTLFDSDSPPDCEVITGLYFAENRRHNDVTIIPSIPLLVVSRFCTPPEVKFHVFSTSKHGRKTAIEYNFCYIYQYIVEI